MPAALSIRDDISAEELRRTTRLEANGRVACRLLAIANALDGMSRERAAEQAGIDRQSLRDWVIRFNADGMPGLQDRPRSGRPSFLDDGELAVFRTMVLLGPDVERDGVSSWTAKDLCRLVEARFGVRYQESGMLKLLHGLGLSKQKTRPSHPKADPAAQAMLDELAKAAAPKAHAVVLMDQAGWHRAHAPTVPDNLTLAFLPPYSPELNVIERVWLHLKERDLSHRVWWWQI